MSSHCGKGVRFHHSKPCQFDLKVSSSCFEASLSDHYHKHNTGFGQKDDEKEGKRLPLYFRGKDFHMDSCLTPKALEYLFEQCPVPAYHPHLSWDVVQLGSVSYIVVETSLKTLSTGALTVIMGGSV